MMDKYESIINLPHHISTKHPQMSLYTRSAQFAPFAALVGYKEAVDETSRLTDKRIDIDDGLKEILNQKIMFLNLHLKEHPEITFTYYLKDNKKEGGSYIEYTGIIKKIDQINKIITMNDMTKISMNDILFISGNIFKSFENN